MKKILSKKFSLTTTYEDFIEFFSNRSVLGKFLTFGVIAGFIVGLFYMAIDTIWGIGDCGKKDAVAALFIVAMAIGKGEKDLGGFDEV